MEKRKILFLIPSLVGGGAERTLINLLHRIDLSRYSVTLISVLAKGTYLNQVPEGVKLITLFRNEFLVRTLAYLQKKTGFDLLFRYKMNRNVTQHYDVAICYLDSNFTDLLFLTNKIGKRYTWVHSSYKSYHNFNKFYQNESYRRKLIEKRYSKVDGIYFVSDDAKQEFIEVFGTYPVMNVVYNIIDREMVTQKANAVINFDHSRFSFVTVGSLIPVKGYDRLIRAAKILLDKGYDFKIDVLGKGNEEPSLQKLIQDLGMKDRILLHGFVGNPYPYMKAGDAFVMSSVSEALPTVLCEAMILGKPVIVTNCSGCRELVEEGKYGIIAEQDDQRLAAAMETYLTDKEKLNDYSKMSLCRSAIFDTEKVMESYYGIFNS
jgi:glycosyltransferase involved in cell wall biosynthesis